MVGRIPAQPCCAHAVNLVGEEMFGCKHCHAERRMVGRIPAQPCSAHAINVVGEAMLGCKH
jgi:hypothetical protein